MGTRIFSSGNLLTELPDAADAERFDTIRATAEVRIERIVPPDRGAPA